MEAVMSNLLLTMLATFVKVHFTLVTDLEQACRLEIKRARAPNLKSEATGRPAQWPPSSLGTGLHLVYGDPILCLVQDYGIIFIEILRRCAWVAREFNSAAMFSFSGNYISA